MVNNEFPFSDRGTPMADKQFTFRCSPGYVKALNEMGVDVVSLASNHLDYGREALSDTFAALDGAGILYGGAGDSAGKTTWKLPGNQSPREKIQDYLGCRDCPDGGLEGGKCSAGTV